MEERLKWTLAGHGSHCLIPAATLSNQSVQTDLLEPSVTALCDASIQSADPPHVDASVQVSESPPSLSQSQEAIAEPHNWAEDANSLPVIPSPPSLPHQLRDLSVLRSSSSSPFSSLQHRSKRFTCRSRSHYHSHSHFNSFYSLHRYSFEPHSKTCSHLNWESDPWLSDLSHSLKALGCIHAS